MIRLIDVSALALMLLNASAFAADKLGVFPVDPAQISVAGISSGAFMANQLHIAHSADIMGAAMVVRPDGKTSLNNVYKFSRQ
jgi:poly(3-hydroxybutyrate) depolymerase